MTIACCVAAAGARAEPAASETTSLDVIITGPDAQPISGKAEIQLRIFEGEDPDAPPNVTNIAVENVVFDPLKFPVTLKVVAPKARLAGALQPAVGIIIVANGNMVYWNEAIAPLERSGPTQVRVVPVP